MQIISRAQWGARAPRVAPTKVAPSHRAFFVVHHSGAPASQSPRDIQNWCMDKPPHGRGFNDVDYNFLVDQQGRIYEGRGWDVVGSHTTGYNTTGIGVCVIGNNEISDEVKDALRWLYQQAVSRAGHPLAAKGHRQLATTGTDCPGDKVFGWVHGGMVVAQSGPRVLREGMSGDDVRALQVKLSILADGDFGPKTTSALIAFQKKNGLDADGVVGPLTRAKLGLG